jgi:excisionase family DNA binding protein
VPRQPATDNPDFPTPVSSRRIPPPEVRPPLPSSSDHSGVPIRALFTVAEALQVLGVSRQTLYRALHEDRLCAHKIRGKTVFKRASLIDFLDGLEERRARVA